jgi:hypothetical protein
MPAWNEIEAEYRAGIKSNVAIANEYEVSEGAIRKRAKKEDWVKDLGAQIKSKADSLVRAQAVREEVRASTAVSEKEIIEANATMQANKILEHRTDIQRYRALASKLVTELELTSDNQELFEKLGELLIDTTDDQDTGQAKRLEALNKAMSMSSRIDSLKKLAETLKVLIGLEREAFGLNNEPTEKPKELSHAELDDKLSKLLRKAGFVPANAGQTLQ